jgi:hypothetical protein
MFNYKFKSDMTHWTYNVEANAFVVKSKEKIPKGEEVLLL